MKVILLNALAITLAGFPMILLIILAEKYEWVKKREEGLNVICWIVFLVLLYLIVLPALNLKKNPDFWRNLE